MKKPWLCGGDKCDGKGDEACWGCLGIEPLNRIPIRRSRIEACACEECGHHWVEYVREPAPGMIRSTGPEACPACGSTRGVGILRWGCLGWGAGLIVVGLVWALFRWVL